MAKSRYIDSYTSFSGADIVCTFNGHVIGTIAGINWSISREKAAVYTMGSANPRSFSRGKRGIAGTLLFQQFDRDVLWQLVQNDRDMDVYKRASEWNHDVYAEPTQDTNSWWSQSLDVLKGKAFYSDEVPPFDITLSFANEYGAMARKEILGVEILNEGSGVSMDDILTEQTMTFVARGIGKLVPDRQWFVDQSAA
jgi:hypothetical protein